MNSSSLAHQNEKIKIICDFFVHREPPDMENSRNRTPFYFLNFFVKTNSKNRLDGSFCRVRGALSNPLCRIVLGEQMKELLGKYTKTRGIGGVSLGRIISPSFLFQN